MFVLRRKDNNLMFCFEDKQSVSLLCRDRDAADRAIAKIRREYAIECISEDADPTTLSGLWCLAYRNGHKLGPERGVNIVCNSETVASKCAGGFLSNTGKIVKPVPVNV